MSENFPDRKLLMRSRLEAGYRMSESALKNLQHVLTDWLPRTLYGELTDDATSVDVLIRKDFATNKSIFCASFIKADGSVIKNTEYAESRLSGGACPPYDPKKSRYDGNMDGFDLRVVLYSTDPKVTNRTT
jgi:hypothetical protein